MNREEDLLEQALEGIRSAELDIAEAYDQLADGVYDNAGLAAVSGLEKDLYQEIESVRDAWVRKLVAKNASPDTIRRIKPDYQPEAESAQA